MKISINLLPLTFFLIIGFLPTHTNASITNKYTSYETVISFKPYSTELDSSNLESYYNLVKYLNKLDFVSKYKIVFTPYILISEFQKDKSIGWKRYLYLKKLFKRDLKTKYKIYFFNKTVRRETIRYTGLWYSLSNIK